MIKNKQIWLMTGLAALAAGLAIFDLQKEKYDSEKKDEKAKVISFSADQVSQIEIFSTGGKANSDKNTDAMVKMVRLKKTIDGWVFEEPLQEAADTSAVLEFVEGLVTEKTTETVASGEDLDLRVFGLDQPKGRLVVQNNLGEKIEIAVSAKKNYQGESFIRRNEEKNVFLASSNWLSKIEKSDFDFRDKRLLKRSMAGIKSLAIQNSLERFNLLYQDQSWKLEEHSEWKLDQNKVRDVLGFLTNANISTFLKSSEVTSDDMKNFGLSSPKASITAQFDNSEIKWQLGQSSEKLNTVLIGQPSQIVSVEAAEAAKILNLKKDLLRDRKEFLAFAKAQVHRIEVQGAEGLSVFSKKGEAWKIDQKASTELNIAPELVQNFVQKLDELQVAEFLENKTSLPEKFVKNIKLFDDKEKLLLDLKLAEPAKKKTQQGERMLVVAQSNLSKDYFTLDSPQVRGLNIDSLLKSMPQDTSKSTEEKK